MTLSSENKCEKDAEENKTKRQVNLDMILEQEIGQFGKYQFRVLFLSIIVVIFTSFGASEYIFTTARINTRCLIPECDSEDPEFRPSWITNAIPESSGTLDNCQRFGNTSQIYDVGFCPATLFDQSYLQPCEQYVYENTHTVVYDFDLACDEWRRALIGSIRTVGTLLALPITGYISDRWGRRAALIFNAVNTAWLGIMRYFANTLVGFIISEVVEAIFGSGLFSSAYILMMEITGRKYRVAAGAAMSTFFSVSQIIVGLTAWRIPDWRKFTIALYTPMLITISYIWLMSESVRWYMSKGRYKDSEALLLKMAKVNDKTLSPQSLEALRENTEQEKIMKELEISQKEDTPWLIVLVFRNKRILLRCAVSPVWWITTTLVYYGLSINAVNISGNRYVNYMAVAATDIPGYWAAVFLVGKIGRKPVLTGAFWICAACQAAYIFLPDSNYGLSLTFYLIGNCSIACVSTAVYVYTAELYPTKYRHGLFAFSAMMGRLGSITAPLTPAFNAATFDSFSFVLFGSLALLSGFLIFLTPETLGTSLPDTLEEANSLGQNNKTNE